MAFFQNYMEFWNFPSKFSVCTFGTCCTYAVSSQKGAADKCWICTNVSKSKQSKCYSISPVLWCLEINIGSAYLGRFGAFLSVSAAYSLPNWWSLQFCLVTEKCRLGNTILKKKEKRGNWSPAWNTCSSRILKPRHFDGPWGQPGAELGACPYWCWTWHSIIRISASRQVLFHMCPQLSPCFFSQRSWISSPFFAHLIVSCFPHWKIFFSTPHLILCVKNP